MKLANKAANTFGILFTVYGYINLEMWTLVLGPMLILISFIDIGGY